MPDDVNEPRDSVPFDRSARAPRIVRGHDVVEDRAGANGYDHPDDAQARSLRLQELQRGIEEQRREAKELINAGRRSAPEGPAPAAARPTPEAPSRGPAAAQSRPGVAPAVQSAETGMQDSTPQPQGITAAPEAGTPLKLPIEFAVENEHPMIAAQFVLTLNGACYVGTALSLTKLSAQLQKGEGLAPGARGIGLMQFVFDGFTLSIQPELVAQEMDVQGTTTFLFADPTGAHLPQLRYILNSVIAGDVVSLDGVMSYSGPLAPKEPKPEPEATWRDRARPLAGLAISAMLVIGASALVASRYMTEYEFYPVSVTRDGQTMRATAAGQIAYLNPEAGQGEVAFSVNSNTGDVLNFTMPCDCDAIVQSGIAEGSTVLRTDLVMTIFDNMSSPRVETLMSVEGLGRALRGDAVHMEMTDGRSIPVRVVTDERTHAARLRGDLFVPVTLASLGEAFTEADIGKSAQLRLSKDLFRWTGVDTGNI